MHMHLIKYVNYYMYIKGEGKDMRVSWMSPVISECPCLRRTFVVLCSRERRVGAKRITLTCFSEESKEMSEMNCKK